MAQIVKEIGSGVNDARPKLMKLLTDNTVTLSVVEHKDRLTRFGFNYIEQLLKLQDRQIEVINQVEAGKEDLVHDFVSIVTSFCARLYGQRRSKRKTERILAELQTEELHDKERHEGRTEFASPKTRPGQPKSKAKA